MWIHDHFREVLLLGPIVGLLLVGIAISLRSRLEDAGAEGVMRRLLGNGSHLLPRLAGYGVALLAMQRFIGIRMDLGW